MARFHLRQARAVLIGAALASIGLAAPRATAADRYALQVLSTRPDMVSGPRVLVKLTTPSISNLTVRLGNKDVTAAFRPGSAKGTLIGVVEGLRIGKNTLTARIGGQLRATLEITDYPITGPILSGKLQTPFMCQTEDFILPVTGDKLGAPLDADCSVATRIDYIYKAADGTFKPLKNPADRPTDLSQTRTKDGRLVNFIVRVETGTINRSIFQIAMLDDPASDPTPDPWHRPAGWNGRLVYTFGGGCNAGYHQGSTMAVVGPPTFEGGQYLALGYAVATATFNTWANNCNDVLSAETVMMVRQHFIDMYGLMDHTIGVGCSGGAMQVHLVVQNYPGLLDGVIAPCTHPDIISYYTNNISDSALLANVFALPDLGLSDDQKSAISGYANWSKIGTSWSGYSRGLVTPNGPRGIGVGCNASLPTPLLYDPVKNPRGTRCTLYDNMVNIFGRDPKTGFARRALDNVGVEYGLVAFNQGKISAEQFVTLNEKIGGYGVDGAFVPERMTGDPEAIRIAYATGQVVEGSGGLAKEPIIIIHNYEDATNHHALLDAYMTRARLVATNGDADNLVIVTYPGGRPITTLPDELLLKMDAWLDNLAKITGPYGRKDIAKARPTDLVDACYTADGTKITEPARFDSTGKCNQLYPPHGNPRMAAGGPVASDVLKCALKPIRMSDYKQPLNSAQLARLRAVFPKGVCDYTRPGIDQRPVVKTWLRY